MDNEFSQDSYENMSWTPTYQKYCASCDDQYASVLLRNNEPTVLTQKVDPYMTIDSFSLAFQNIPKGNSCNVFKSF